MNPPLTFFSQQISMDQVVLPDDQKAILLRTVDNFAKFKAYRHRAGLEDVISYGAGLVILLCGASGTGKTMTVNAMAHHLGMARNGSPTLLHSTTFGCD